MEGSRGDDRLDPRPRPGEFLARLEWLLEEQACGWREFDECGEVVGEVVGGRWVTRPDCQEPDRSVLAHDRRIHGRLQCGGGEPDPVLAVLRTRHPPFGPGSCPRALEQIRRPAHGERPADLDWADAP